MEISFLLLLDGVHRGIALLGQVFDAGLTLVIVTVVKAAPLPRKLVITLQIRDVHVKHLVAIATVHTHALKMDMIASI